MQSSFKKASVMAGGVFRANAIKIPIAGFSTLKTRPIPSSPLNSPGNPGSRTHTRSPWSLSEQQIAGFSTSKTRPISSSPLNYPGNQGSSTHTGNPWPLSEQQKKVILEHPLGRTLDSARDKLRDSNEADDTHRGYIADLLHALYDSPAALKVPFPAEKCEVDSRLYTLRKDVRGGKIANLDPFRPLVRHIVDNSDDNAIWAVVFSLLDTLTTRSSVIIAPTYTATPGKTSSNRLEDGASRETVEKALFVEMKDYTFRNVGGFMDKFFNPESWRDEQKAMLEKIKTEHNGAEWTGFPATPDEKPVWDWLCSLEERFLADAPYKLQTTTSASQFGNWKGQVDIFTQAKTPEATTTFNFKHVLVVGEHKKSYNASRFKADFLQLARYVRSVFYAQPTRRFVHAFSLCGSQMEVWIFDRAGAYSSGTIDIQKSPDMFARALVGYVTMDPDAMGLDIFTERVVEGGDEQCYVTLNDTSGKERRFRLQRPMYKQNAIACRGTTCYTTDDNEVVKFAWASAKRREEVDLLAQVQEKDVKGVAGMVAYHRITTIAEIRKGLQFPTAHWFRDDLPSTTTSTPTSGSKNKATSGSKNKATSGSKDKAASGSKDKAASGSKRKATLDATTNTVSGSTPSEDLWEQRVYSCLVISPAGHVISRFGAIKQLLESMRDAIKAHQSLYVTGNILHRDISPNNIIMTDPRVADGFHGMLIDLDMAKVRGDDPSGARQITGTVQFMAIEVLRNIDHTYRHDLESFFYVLLWLCGRQSWYNKLTGSDEEAPDGSYFERWEEGTLEKIALAKKGDMSGAFDELLQQFPESFKVLEPLCRKIKDILFPSDNKGKMILGTPAGDPDQLYRPIIEAYNEAIDKL